MCWLRHYPWHISGGRSLASKVFAIRVDAGLFSTAQQGAPGAAQGLAAAPPKDDTGAGAAGHTMSSVTACAGDYIVFQTVWADTTTASHANTFKSLST